MFFIMQKPGAFIFDKRKYKKKLPVQISSCKTLEEARKRIECTGLYIEFGKTEIKHINKELANDPDKRRRYCTL